MHCGYFTSVPSTEVSSYLQLIHGYCTLLTIYSQNFGLGCEMLAYRNWYHFVIVSYCLCCPCCQCSQCCQCCQCCQYCRTNTQQCVFYHFIKAVALEVQPLSSVLSVMSVLSVLSVLSVVATVQDNFASCLCKKVLKTFLKLIELNHMLPDGLTGLLPCY